jgi:hypothetical protein
MADDLNGVQMWYTVHELVGIPGFPTGVSNVRNKLEKLSEGMENVRRRREGGKAVEYHFSILPEMSKQYLGVTGLTPASVAVNAERPDNSRTMWEIIYTSMTPNQREAVVDVFVTGGLKQLMPDVIELANVESSERREILLQRHTVENAHPASDVSTHGKKAG